MALVGLIIVVFAWACVLRNLLFSLFRVECCVLRLGFCLDFDLFVGFLFGFA